MRPDVRCREEDARAAAGGLATQDRALLDDPAPSSPDGQTCEWQSTKAGRAIDATLSSGPALRSGGRTRAPARPSRSSRRARASSWRTRSRVMPRPAPTSSSVCGVSPSSPKRSASTCRIRGLRLIERVGELACAQPVGGRRVGPGRVRVLDQVAVQALAVADGRLEADRVLDELEQLAHALRREARSRPRSRRASGRGSASARGCRRDAHDAAHLLGDVHRQPDRPALVGERARDRLADPPRRVGRELVAHACSRTSRPRGSGRGCPPGSGRGAARRPSCSSG